MIRCIHLYLFPLKSDEDEDIPSRSEFGVRDVFFFWTDFTLVTVVTVVTVFVVFFVFVVSL